MRAQRQFWTDLCPPFGQNVARKAGTLFKRYEKQKNENSRVYSMISRMCVVCDFTKSRRKLRLGPGQMRAKKTTLRTKSSKKILKNPRSASRPI